jgi:hypothetical protein
MESLKIWTDNPGWVSPSSLNIGSIYLSIYLSFCLSIYFLSIYLFIYLFILSVLGIELRALHLPGQCSIT